MFSENVEGYCYLKIKKSFQPLNTHFSVQCLPSALTARGLGKVCYTWASCHQARWPILGMVKMVWKTKYVLFLWSGVWRKRCGQLLNGGLKIYRSTSVSVWRSQWTDLSPRWAGARRKGWSEWWGRSDQNRGKRTPGNLCSEFWLWDKKQLCKNGSLWRELWYFLQSNSWILNIVMSFYRTLTFIHSWNKTSCSLEGEGSSVTREKSRVQRKARSVGGGGGGGAVKHTV